MTIRRRLILSVTAGLIVVLVLSGLLTVTLVQGRLISDVDDDLRLRTEAIAVAADFADGLSMADLSDLPDEEPGPNPATFDTAITIFDRSGTLLAQVNDGTASDPGPGPDLAGIDPATLVDDFRTVPASDDSIGYRVTGVAIGEVATAVVAINLTDVERAQRAITGMTTLVGIVAALVVAGSAWLIISRELRPIDSMIGTAEDIAGGDLTSRIDVAEPNSEVGHLGTALNTMLGQIQEGVDAKVASEERMRRFISDASHELRTPLTSIRGYAELHERGALDDGGVELAFRRIGDEARRMGDLVEDLLTLARLDQAPELAVADVDLSALLRESVQDAQAVEPDRQFTLDAPDELHVRGDGDRLRQAIANLLANARIHTSPGTPIAVAAEQANGALRITVSDAGPGLSPEQVERVFDRFYQATPDRATAGSGLGLAIVKSIAEAHGGAVAIQSAPGEGTTVTIEMPAE